MSHRENYIPFLGLHLHNCSEEELLGEVNDILQNGSVGVILPVNVHFINLMYKNPWLREFLGTIDHVVCDGRGVQLTAKVLGYHGPQHIRFMDWVYRLFDVAEQKGYRIYFLGAMTETIRVAVERIRALHPKLQIAGFHNGYFHQSRAENDRVVGEINRFTPDILLTGFSMPVEERWLMEHRDRLRVKLFVLGAGCFEYLAGRKRLCPRWISNLGFEWLWRLVHEPRRLFVRYVVGNPLFIIRVLKQKFTNHQAP